MTKRARAPGRRNRTVLNPLMRKSHAHAPKDRAERRRLKVMLRRDPEGIIRSVNVGRCA